MKITVGNVKTLREQSGAGVMECRNALVETGGDIEKATQVLKERNLFKAEKKKQRATTQGLIDTYVHTGGRIGAVVELNCETDFVARTDEFKQLAHDLAMQVAAMSPQFISKEEISAGVDITDQSVCLVLQPFIKCTDMTIQDLINQTIGKLGENIKVGRFVRFEVGEA
ncbi:MAG: elongation factor Ts [Dehalococcoidales bacterium]|nr:elongation factor Ts [Dehalococcoidales bacterium]MDP7309676.1 elongation factor Ts [Dehalococcoidales bacterium]MDP7409391.1 elongation factor Ts [Dehalococcoidales bacterium]MDP7675726.1 elongation factor Ts [Dehalococcoidales bacterium]HJM36726.1 elongation factor Ts [Dehalococcoidales bacterium]